MKGNTSTNILQVKFLIHMVTELSYDVIKMASCSKLNEN